jgi:hypothetical protein
MDTKLKFFGEIIRIDISSPPSILAMSIPQDSHPKLQIYLKHLGLGNRNNKLWSEISSL